MEGLLSSHLLWLVLTIGIYSLASALYRQTKRAYLHPVLLTFLLIIALLRGARVEYEQYREATQILDFMLSMSVVSLGYLLYEQLDIIKRHILPLLIATVVSTTIGILSVVYTAMALGADRVLLTSLAPKSVTVPIAIAVSEPLGAIVAITSVVVFFVGVLGSICGPWFLRQCGVRNGLAQGFALGASAHGIGTARAIEMGATQGAISGLAMALMGVATAVILPLVERYLY